MCIVKLYRRELKAESLKTKAGMLLNLGSWLLHYPNLYPATATATATAPATANINTATATATATATSFLAPGSWFLALDPHIISVWFIKNSTFCYELWAMNHELSYFCGPEYC